MWDPATDTCIEDAALSANNLNELLDLMHANYGRMNLPQCEALLGLALNLSAEVAIWLKEEEKRRENKSD
ncbi:TPA: hypothetical protein NHV36_005515 [Klebsiella michiganensis]|uniref:hypothetical protein n=1 Tax=Klebsiella grimontii TaxID=2058152 RepID=UPI00292D8536|nr:hypothetical protein [Klebsiella grimontii]HCE8860820.1 hypothetical protein [Klebsiella michiganensis]HCE9046501.1 hypothetical protein [Klebsiella michiganensis]HCE9080533.1 hypothetical protein [Klebsiella michiganensis]HED3409716.1 hypothetical protein [Klebsiella michiganensis]